MEDFSTRGFPIKGQPKALVIATSLVLFVPFTGVAIALYRFATGRFTWLEVTFLLVFLIASLLGTGLGLHRYFSHNTFTAKRGLKIALGILGCTGGIGPVTWFSAIHRRHHRFADSERDPHTPKFPVLKSWLQLPRNIWVSSFGFGYRFGPHAVHLMKPERDTENFTKEFRASVKDLTSDADIMWIDRNYYVWMVLFWILPGVLMSMITRDFWSGFLWGGIARQGFCQLVFGTINVVGHSVGPRPFKSYDQSRNLYLFALFSNGESLHNNHHAFPWTAKTTLAWWQIDLNYYFLVLFKALGWATDVRIPTTEELAKKKA